MYMGYAKEFSYREEVGSDGMSEIFDSAQVLEEKIAELAAMIKKSKHLVAFTGAGISTSCVIADGESKGKDVPGAAQAPLHCAMPGIAHMALAELEKAGILKCVISQNADSLHHRSGIPREKLAELHGNSFRENLPSYEEAKERLNDTVVDWEVALPLKEMQLAEEHCLKADVVLCLGSSLQITLDADFPLQCLFHGGKIVIVNLQPTPVDNKASLIIHGLVDKVMAGIVHHLDLRIPPSVRVDLFQITFIHYPQLSGNSVKYSLRIGSAFGLLTKFPLIKSVEVTFLNMPDLKTAILNKTPFKLKREISREVMFTLVIKLNFCDSCGIQSTTVEFPVNFQKQLENISRDKDDVAQELTNAAVESRCCGQISLVKSESLPSKRKDIAVFAVATNMVCYESLLDSYRIPKNIPEENNNILEENNDNDNVASKLMPPKKRKHHCCHLN